jgi:hypothetical protein
MATQLGKPVSVGFAGTDGIAETTFLTGKIILQSADFENAADKGEVRNAAGDVVSEYFYNQSSKANLEYFATGTTIAGVTANLSLPTIPTILNITACADLPALIKTNWMYKGGGKITGSNTDAKKITLPLEALTNITSVAS